MIINDELLNSITEEARENPRLRKNYNFHKSENDSVQRLLNALEPGTNLPIHRHNQTDETYVLLRGEINVFFYNNDKQLTETYYLNPLKGNYGINIPSCQWHSIEVLEPGSVIFEVKEGPYAPLTANDMME